MSSFTQVFGGSAIAPSQVSYRSITLEADTALVWPLEAEVGEEVAATIIDITTAGNFLLTLPDARLVSPGETLLLNNLGPDAVTVLNAFGNAILTLLPGTVWQTYLTSNTSAAGSWRVFQYGASTAQAQATALAGAGLVAVGSVLAQSNAVSTVSSGPFTVVETDRAQTFIWIGALGTFNLPSTSVVGNNWFINVRNDGSGDLTLDPAGSETINGDASLRLSPGDSAVLVTDGTDWWTIGLGQQAIFAFDFTAISLNGLGSPSITTDYVLAGSELNRIVYRFTGNLSGDIEVVVPATIQQYWFDNSTTGGSYTVSIKAAGSATIIGVPRGQRGIYYCDGTKVVKADTTSGVPVPLTIAEGGTSATSATNARTNLGAAAAGANSDITSLTGLTTPLSAAQGGTGSSVTPTAGSVAYGDGTKLALTAAGVAGQLLRSNGASPPSWVTVSGAGTVTSVNATTTLSGLSFVGGPVTVSGTLSLAGTLGVVSGGTGATAPSGARANLLPSYAGNSGKVLAVNATSSDVEWITPTGGGSSGVSSFSAGSTGLTPSAASTGAVTLGGVLSINSGGTGATSSAGARAAIGAATAGGNSDIAALYGLGDGSASTPSVGFASESGLGIYRAISGGTSGLALACGSAPKVYITSEGLQLETGAVLSIAGGKFTLPTSAAAPTSSSATGRWGELRFDSSYLYVCVATNTWRRVALSTW